MNNRGDSVGFLEILQLLIPIATFAMGYLLTNIGYKRDRKLSVIREKFVKLYHPFYLLVNELGTDTEDGAGFAFDTEDTFTLKRFFDLLLPNVYLASSEGQKLILETRMLFFSNIAKDNHVDEDKAQLFENSISALFGHLIQEYVKSAKALGYDLCDAEGQMGIIES